MAVAAAVILKLTLVKYLTVALEVVELLIDLALPIHQAFPHRVTEVEEVTVEATVLVEAAAAGGTLHQVARLMCDPDLDGADEPYTPEAPYTPPGALPLLPLLRLLLLLLLEPPL